MLNENMVYYFIFKYTFSTLSERITLNLSAFLNSLSLCIKHNIHRSCSSVLSASLCPR